jgi:hypothetical protein
VLQSTRNMNQSGSIEHGVLERNSPGIVAALMALRAQRPYVGSGKTAFVCLAAYAELHTLEQGGIATVLSLGGVVSKHSEGGVLPQRTA